MRTAHTLATRANVPHVKEPGKPERITVHRDRTVLTLTTHRSERGRIDGYTWHIHAQGREPLSGLYRREADAVQALLVVGGQR